MPGAPVKPDILAPGQRRYFGWGPIYTIGNSNYDPVIIDDDGFGLSSSNSGPANYFVMEGTSMASAMAAGVGALILGKSPGLTRRR